MNEKMQDALNDQINAEYFSSYLYLSMAAYFEAESLPGFANWMRIQTQEELAHANKFFDFVAERGGRVKLTAIKAPEIEWKSPLDAFEAAYKHEQYITGRINDLVAIAREVKDFAADNFLQWFVAEQVEEESTADAIVQDLKRAGDNPQVLMMLDRELGARVFIAPAAEGA